MYFLPEQVADVRPEADAGAGDLHQPDLFVHDEETAIRWLRRELRQEAAVILRTYTPSFIRELAGWGKNETDAGAVRTVEGELPSLRRNRRRTGNQIHSYLSSNFKHLRNLPKDDPSLRHKGKDRWYVPDPRKAGDLEKVRERGLLREFDEYRETDRRLKRFRSEAIRAGFRRAWQERDYATIASVGRRIPDNVLQNDPKLLMWFDQAVTREGDQP